MTRNYRWNIQRKFHGEWIFHDICRDTRGIKWRNAKCNRNARDLIAKRLLFSILKTKKNRHRKIEAFKRGRGGEKERKREKEELIRGIERVRCQRFGKQECGEKGRGKEGGSEMAATWRIKRAFWWRKLVVGSALDATSAREWRKKRWKRKQG